MENSMMMNCESLVRQIPDPLLIFSRTGRILAASRAFEDISGYRFEEIAGKNAFTAGLICKESIPTVRKNLLNRFFGRKVELYDAAVRIKNGSILIAEVNGALIDFNGVKAVLTVFRDVTEKRQKIEQTTIQLQQAIEKLEERAHELKKMNELMVGRELKMLELKERLEKLAK